jgi:hypothetical protein
MNELRLKRLRIPYRSYNHDETKYSAVQAALTLKLLKTIKSIENRIARLEEAVLKTVTRIKTNITRLTSVFLPITLLDVKGTGCVKSIVIRSDTKDFKLSLFIDDLLIFDNDFSWFEKMSPYLKEIVALEANGDYIFAVYDLKFTTSAKVIAKPTTNEVTILKEVYINYDLGSGVG